MSYRMMCSVCDAAVLCGSAEEADDVGVNHLTLAHWFFVDKVEDEEEE